MGITPITNLFPLPVARTAPPDLEPLPMERVASSPRTGDGSYSQSGGRSARGSEDNVSEEESNELDDDSAEAVIVPSGDTGAFRKISFFA